MKFIAFLCLFLSAIVLFSQNNKNVVSVIFDTSGSMKNNNNDLKMKKYLISISKAIYNLNNEIPDINLNFLLAEFNDKGNILYNSPLKTEQQLKEVEKIINGVKVNPKAGTDYHQGLATIIETIKKDYPTSQIKPLFITDGIDGGKGVVANYDYTSVSHTSILLVENVDKSKDKDVIDGLDRWKSAIPNSDYKFVDKISDVQDELFYTLITSINTNTKLIRYGELKSVGDTLIFEKHNDENVAIFLFAPVTPKSIKDTTNVTISEITENLYKIKFTGKAGNYYINFDKKPVKNRYLSIENGNISNSINFTPDKSQKFIVNSQLGFNVKYFDKAKKSEISYKDFLDLVYIEIKIENEAKETVYNQLFEKQIPAFSKSFDKGKYNIFAKWSYSKKHLTSQNFEQIDSFETSEEGVLVNLNYNADSIWEYKEEKIVITLPETPKKVISSIEIELKSDNNIIDKITLNKTEENKYEGIIPPLKSGVYFMNILKSDTLILAPSQDSKIEFTVKPRVLTWEITENSKKLMFDKNNIIKDIELPYYESFSFNSTFKATVSKIFENEKILITCQVSGKQNYKEELTTYTFKLLSSTSMVDDAITSEINCPSITELTINNDSFELIVSLNKKEGGIDLKQLTPQTYATFNFKLVNTKEFDLPTAGFIINAKTEQYSKKIFQTKQIALWISIGIIVLVFFLVAIFILLWNIVHRKSLLRLWAKIHSSILKDFWESSEFGCISIESKLVIPWVLKKVFNDNREEFIKFLNLNITTDRKKILKKLLQAYGGFAIWKFAKKRKELRNYVDIANIQENVPSKWLIKEANVILSYNDNSNNSVRIKNKGISQVMISVIGDKIRLDGINSEKVMQDRTDLNNGRFPIMANLTSPFEIHFINESIKVIIKYKNEIFDIETKKGV